MSDAIRDGNFIPTALGVSSANSAITLPFTIDSATGRALVDVAGGNPGTVTSVSVVSANGFAGTVATATSTPAITLSTTITGILSGNGTGISAASTTGSGAVVLATSPTLVTPILGVAAATTINRVTLTAPATGSTLTIVDGKTLTVNNSIQLSGTDSTVMTFPSTSATIARTDAANTFTGIQTITNITLPDQGQIKLTVPTTDLKATGPTCGDFNCGYSSSAIGDLVYLDSSSTWQKCDANTLALYNGFLGIALEVKASGSALLVALPGSFVYSTTGFPTWTIGSPIYMSETPGAMTQTQPTTTDAAIRVVGWGIHADKMYFFPSSDYITHT